MKIIEAYATKNKCYQVAEKIKVKGLMLHSIGVPQPSAKVMANQFNQFKPNGTSVCVHAFIGADGNVYQILPWDYESWHCGDAANSTHIGVEMTEPATIKYTGGASWVETSDGKNTKKHIIATYNTAVELFAFLCDKYNLDPMKDGVIISHSEGYKRGIASNHGDVEHIWKKFGLTMDGFRKAVKNKMAENNAIETANKPTANVIELPTLRKGETGSQGPQGATGANGHSPVVTASKSGTVTTIKVDGTSIATINDGATGSQGPQGPKGETGATGAAGHTPVKGTDYWTSADRQGIINDVLAAIPIYGGAIV